MKKKVAIEAGALGVLLAALGGTLWYFNSGSSAQSVAATTRSVAYKPMGVENPQIHWYRLDETQRTEYKSSGRDIFSLKLPPPPPPPAPVQVAEVEPAPPPPPPPPPPPKLPLKFYGYGAVPNSPGRRAFLTDGQAVYIVAEGDTVLGRYRVLKINTMSLDFEEISSGRRASTPLEDQGQGN